MTERECQALEGRLVKATFKTGGWREGRLVRLTDQAVPAWGVEHPKGVVRFLPCALVSIEEERGWRAKRYAKRVQRSSGSSGNSTR